MMAHIKKPKPKAGRIQFKIPPNAIEWRSEIKKINGYFWNNSQKQWSIPNSSENMDKLAKIFGANFLLTSSISTPKIPLVNLSESSKQILDKAVQKLILGSYSQSTVKSYRSCIIKFLGHFKDREIAEIAKSEIEDYVYILKSKYKISDSKQNTIILSLIHI